MDELYDLQYMPAELPYYNSVTLVPAFIPRDIPAQFQGFGTPYRFIKPVGYQQVPRTNMNLFPPQQRYSKKITTNRSIIGHTIRSD